MRRRDVGRACVPVGEGAGEGRAASAGKYFAEAVSAGVYLYAH